MPDTMQGKELFSSLKSSTPHTDALVGIWEIILQTIITQTLYNINAS
jgi:hypothetical protein